MHTHTLISSLCRHADPSVHILSTAYGILSCKGCCKQPCLACLVRVASLTAVTSPSGKLHCTAAHHARLVLAPPCSSCLGCLLKAPVRQWYIGVPEQALLDPSCIFQRLTELSLASLSFWHRRSCDKVVCVLLPRPQVSRRHLRSTLPISALLCASMPGRLNKEMPSSLDDRKGGMTCDCP